jgi:hypothetical protein
MNVYFSLNPALETGAGVGDRLESLAFRLVTWF